MGTFSPSSLPRLAGAAPARAPRGMTLVEVMIATGILVFGMVAILAIILTAQRSHQRAVHETNAVQVANSVLAEWRVALNQGQTLQVCAPDRPFDQLLTLSDYPDYRYAVTAKKLEAQRYNAKAPPLGEEYFVEVTVFWSQRGEAQSALFQTVMFARVKPGTR
jgi:type II secretory pathway pseudopilin PulG